MQQPVEAGQLVLAQEQRAAHPNDGAESEAAHGVANGQDGEVLLYLQHSCSGCNERKSS